MSLGQTARLAGKIALVTGGASGFGASIATLFAQHGAKVLVADLDLEKTQGVIKSAKEGSSNMTALRMDVSKPEEWKKAVEEVQKQWGGVDILVNNAGTTYKNKPTLEVTESEFQRVFSVNVTSIYHSVNAVVPLLISQKRGGSIINIASIGAMRPRPGLVWYNASKAAVANASKALAAEYGPHQIRVNALCPLLSGTGLFESFSGVPHTEENVKNFLSNVPLGRLTDPIDVANTCVFLASDEGKFITGTNLEIDGGRGV